MQSELVACYPKSAVTPKFPVAPNDSHIKTDDSPVPFIRGRVRLWTDATGGRR
jgi:hypothetical protein